jgi:hypothetical protein
VTQIKGIPIGVIFSASEFKPQKQRLDDANFYACQFYRSVVKFRLPWL